MAAPRRKAPKIDAPSTIGEATNLIAEYLHLSASIEDAKAQADAAIRKIEHARDELIAPAEAELKDKFAQLRTWWAVARDQLTEGKRKSIELAGALIGDRTTPPSLALPKGVTAGDLIETILSEGFEDDYLVVRYALDKQRMIKLLRGPFPIELLQPGDDPAELERLHRKTLADEFGLSVVQRDEFFIARAAPKDPDPIVEQIDGEAVS